MEEKLDLIINSMLEINSLFLSFGYVLTCKPIRYFAGSSSIIT